MSDPISEFEKKLRKGKKFEKKETKGDVFRKKLKDVSEKKSNGNVIVVIDGKEYDVSDIGKINKGGKTVKSLQELKPAKPGIGKPTGKIQTFAKGGRAEYRMGGKCKLAKRGKGRAYGKNS